MKQLKQWASVALLSFASLASHAAGAPAPQGTWVAYTYTGQNLTTRAFDVSSMWGQPSSGVESVNRIGVGFDVLLPAYLAPGESIHAQYTQEWDGKGFDITLSTDDSGNIVAWDVSSWVGLGPYWKLSTRSGPNASDHDNYRTTRGTSEYFSNQGSPGSWTVALVDGEYPWAYPSRRLDGATGRSFSVLVLPEPETYALTLIGLLMVGGMAKRQASRTGQRSAR